MRSVHRMATMSAAPAMIVVAFLLSGFYIYSGLARADEQAQRARAADEARALLYQLSSFEDKAEAGEPIDIDGMEVVVDELIERVDQLAADGVSRNDFDLRQMTLDYTDAAWATAAAYTEGNAAEADELDDEATEPLLDALATGLENLAADADAKANAAKADERRGLLIGGLAAVIAMALVVSVEIRRRQRESETAARVQADKRFQALVDASPDHLYIIDDGGRILYSSTRTTISKDGTEATSLADLTGLLHEAHRDAVFEAFDAADGDRPIQVTAPAGAKQLWFEIRVFDHRDNPAIANRVITARDITESVRLQRLLERQAVEDELTGLSNRRGLQRHLSNALARCRRRGTSMAVMLVDLDGFKGVNDTLGHPAGDDLLRQVSQRLLRSSRDGEMVGRLGGDEFAVVLEDFDPVAGPVAACERFLEALNAPYTVENEMLSVQASVGMTVSTEASTSETLLSQADIALYDAKTKGGNRYALFDTAMQDAFQLTSRLEREIRPAFERGEFRLAYQPIVSVSNQRLLGLEALMRWDSSLLGAVPPVTFIPAAEQTGFIVVLGQWALKEACHQLAHWRRRLDDDDLWISVNVSVRQLVDNDLLADIKVALSESGLPPSAVQIEITESMAVMDHDDVSRCLNEIRAFGVKIAVDDFGTGYSSMSQLQTLPVDTLKIDRCFIAALDDGDDRALSVVQALVQLGEALGLDVIAEGVEEPSQLATLQEEECELAQGYLFARPMHPDQIDEFLRRRAAHSDNAKTG